MTIKNTLLSIVLALAVLVSIVIFRAVTYQPSPLPQSTAADKVSNILFDSAKVAEHLSQAIQFKTISHQQKSEIDYTQFSAFIDWLKHTYPLVHQSLELTTFNEYTLLFNWRGREPQRKPILLSAHYDVVPVIEGSEGAWTHPPFSGAIDNGVVWGRGALDDKGAVITLMESISALLSDGFQPKRSVYIALTHDEEIGSVEGAGALTEYFSRQKINLEWSLDEGSFVLDSMVPGVKPLVASINVAEKGYLTLELVANAIGGHSSMPPQDNAVSILASAIIKLRNSPVPGGLTGMAEEMYDNLARHMPFSSKILFANRWLFASLIESGMAEIPSANAMLRTTTAPTMLSGSVKANVLPIQAKAKVNFRIHPRDSVDSVIEYVTQVIDDDRIDVVTERRFEPSPVANHMDKGFADIADAARYTYGQVLVTPGLTVGATDSRYYQQATDNSYRFTPMTLTSSELTGFHGTNERISVANLANAVRFYTALIQGSDE